MVKNTAHELEEKKKDKKTTIKYMTYQNKNTKKIKAKKTNSGDTTSTQISGPDKGVKEKRQ